MLDNLYTTDVLALASDIAHAQPLADPDGTAEARSVVCGSTVRVDVKLDQDNRIAAIGAHVEACALGQAALSVLTANAIGAGRDELVAARDALRAMLKEDGPAPTGRFAGLAALKGVAAYPRRHASTMLAFRAAVDAVDAAQARTTTGRTTGETATETTTGLTRPGA